MLPMKGNAVTQCILFVQPFNFTGEVDPIHAFGAFCVADSADFEIHGFRKSIEIAEVAYFDCVKEMSTSCQFRRGVRGPVAGRMPSCQHAAEDTHHNCQSMPFRAPNWQHYPRLMRFLCRLAIRGQHPAGRQLLPFHRIRANMSPRCPATCPIQNDWQFFFRRNRIRERVISHDA